MTPVAIQIAWLIPMSQNIGWYESATASIHISPVLVKRCRARMQAPPVRVDRTAPQDLKLHRKARGYAVLGVTTSTQKDMLCSARRTFTSFPIRLSLSTLVPDSIANLDDLAVTTRITNTGQLSLKLLNHPQTVLSHLPTRMFHIHQGSKTPEFTGMVVHYSPDYVIHKNNSVDFTFLAPGQSLERVHTLSEVYNFTTTGSGQYRIEPYNRFHHVDALGSVLSFEAKTQPSRFKIVGGLARSHKIALKSLGLSNKPTQRLQIGCTIDQQSMITEAATYADQYISNALTYLQSLNGYTPRYGAWFVSAERCFRPMIACPTRVKMGLWFWSRPAYGSNSKAGTIIHELSHFTGTEDYVYGEAGSLQLARSSPLMAVMNADNHMYFAENNPSLQ
ncbi:hypothetical protein OPQ81_002625 [Rhizoctonia solani]|nr:hypothetical protein OPQ81_002625 [Rhizoctonia solani]